MIKPLKRHRGNSSSTVEVEPAGGIYGVFTVDVDFDYTPEYVTRHGENYTFDERHSAEIDIHDIRLTENVHELDEDGNRGKAWEKGTDVSKLPGWNKSDDDYVLEKLYEQATSRDDDCF